MKISCIGLNSNLINSNEQIEVINFLSKKLYEVGESISLISYFDNKLEFIKNILQDKYDIVFLVGTSNPIYNHNIKDNIARIINEKMTTSDVCYANLKRYCENCNISFSMQEETEVIIPENSIPLISETNYNNGFMYKFGETYIIFLPDSLEFSMINYENYISPLINDLVGCNSDFQVIKCFGILEKDIKNLINEYYNSSDISINIVSDDLDNTIYIRYNHNCNFAKVQEIISNIIAKLNKFIYSLEDGSIYKMAIDLLSIQRKHITICETITLGNITKELCNIDDKFIDSACIYVKYDEIVNSLGIDNDIIDNYGKYSVNTIYEFANSTLEKTNSDIVLFVLGNNNNDNICYIAVGDRDGIHVYKNKINIKNDKTINNLSKTAIFYLIKKLKQNDLHFM